MLSITDLLGIMNEKDASDLYLTVDSPPCYRVNGVVTPHGTECLSIEDAEKIARTMMNDSTWKNFRATNESNFALYYPELGRYRVNVFVQRTCVGAVIRRIKSDIPSLDDLHLPEILKKIALLKSGLVLVTGATGSGKSTSLAGMVDHRNSSLPGHIVTVEDPIEFIHMHKKSIVTQREIGIDTDSYFDALKNALRQAPDVILVGEIRDRVTMESAINFSETGHLCLATLHSTNANQTMERILGFFPEERHRQLYLELSLNLRAIISQRLVRTKNNERRAAVEVMLASPLIRDLIANGKVGEIKDAMVRGGGHGMQTFDEHLFQMFRAGLIDFDEALKNADSENNLRLKIKLAKESDEFDAAESFVTDKQRIQDKKNRTKLELEN